MDLLWCQQRCWATKKQNKTKKLTQFLVISYLEIDFQWKKLHPVNSKGLAEMCWFLTSFCIITRSYVCEPNAHYCISFPIILSRLLYTPTDNPCNPNPCYYGSTCVLTSNDRGYNCNCVPGYTGNNCETQIGRLMLKSPVACRYGGYRGLLPKNADSD